MMAMSNRSARRARWNRGKKPSFSMKSTVLKRFLPPAVGKKGRRDRRSFFPSSWPARRCKYWRTSMVPRGTITPVWGSAKQPRASKTTSQFSVVCGLFNR
jgi:hypothetical protein